jgi:Glycosyl-transferase for dystroglycan
MCRGGYLFHILLNAYLVHDGIAEAEKERNSISVALTAENNRLFQQFRGELNARYANATIRSYCDQSPRQWPPTVRRRRTRGSRETESGKNGPQRRINQPVGQDIEASAQKKSVSAQQKGVLVSIET